MKVLVADDEPLARERLVAMVRDSGMAVEIFEAANGRQALEVAGRVDVALLDIRMPGMDGLEAARHMAGLERPPAVIFSTAYDQHALAAFEAHALDYLLKPINQERLVQALSRARRLQAAELRSVSAAGGTRRSHISARLGNNMKLVPLADVRCFIAGQKYVSVCYPTGEVLIEEPLKGLEEEFGEVFLRVHRNALVALAHVQGLERLDDGHYQLRMRDVVEPVAVSRRLVSTVKRRLREA